MDRTATILTAAFFFALILATVILSYDRKTSTDSIEAFIKTEVERQIKGMAIPPVVHGKYVDVRIEGGSVVKEGE